VKTFSRETLMVFDREEGGEEESALIVGEHGKCTAIPRSTMGEGLFE